LNATDGVLSELWLETLEEIAGRAAHEIKGALNGVAVNLEVVRTRADRPGAQASAVASFAHSAAEQLETLTARTEALLALAREPRSPPDVGLLVARVGALLVPAAGAAGGTLELGETPAEARTAAPATAARLAVGAALLAATRAAAEDGGRVSCRIELEAEHAIAMRVERAAGAALVLREEVARAVSDAGIRVEQKADEFTIVFPRGAGPRENRIA